MTARSMAGAQGWAHPLVAPAVSLPDSLFHMGWLERYRRELADQGEVQMV